MKPRVGKPVGPADQRSVREHNLALVVRHVVQNGARSRARIAQETGLNKTTVSSLVAELIDRGLVRETGVANAGGVGRPALTVQLSGEAIVGLGLEVGEGHLGACAVDLSGRVRYRTSKPVENRDAGPEAALEMLAGVASDALSSLAAEGLKTAGVTVALPGLVDIGRQTLYLAPNLRWSEVPVVDLLRRQLGPDVPSIQIDNDANLAALAEMREGVCQDLGDFVLLYGEAGVGIGAGIVSGGELFRGRGGLGGEVGHMPLAPDGPLCRCGNRGCLEVLVGLVAVLDLAGIEGFDYRDGSAQAELARRAEVGDPRTLAALSDVSGVLARGVTALANVLNPAAVVLGGYFASVARWLQPTLERELEAHALAARWSPSAVLVSSLGADAAVLGAAGLALNDVLANPAGVEATRPAVLSP